MKKEDIQNLSYEELVHYLESINEKSFRATQIFEWIYQKGVTSFADMKTLSKALREKCAEQYAFDPISKSNQSLVSKDGTVKFLSKLADGQKIETVLIPTRGRTTVCVSTQAGCKFGCKFCASGLGGFVRQLTVGEIIAQVLTVNNYIKTNPSASNKPITHIVYMGTGEPLDNYDQVMKSIRILNDKKGLNIGARRITISTCGVVPRILQLAEEGIQIEMSVSLNGFDNQSRDILMPVNRRYPFDELIKACHQYVRKTGRQVTFEYILMDEVTTTPEAVRSLKKALKGLISKLNLIPYNPIVEFDFKPSSRKAALAFQRQLKEAGIHSTLRTPRGQDIKGACGQLRHRS